MLLAMLFAALATIASAQETDDDTGLILAEGWDSVRNTCLRCHSAQLITQNAGNETVWKSRITWMQETQGLQQLSPQLEASILGYLAENYGPRQASRRAALASHLIPDNPYPVID